MEKRVRIYLYELKDREGKLIDTHITKQEVTPKNRRFFKGLMKMKYGGNVVSIRKKRGVYYE